jgi:hypothetical protein
MKILKKFSWIIIVLFFLMIWSGIIRNVVSGGNGIGFLTNSIKAFAEMPSNIKIAVKQFVYAPAYYLKTSDFDTKDINTLTYDLYGLYTFRHGDKFDIQLKNFKDNQINNHWEIKVDQLSKYYQVGQNDRLFSASLLEHNNIVVSCDERPGLIRLDSSSNFVWINNDFIFHHAINFDADHNIWIPGVKQSDGIITPNLLIVDNKEVYYRDDLIVHVDSKTGQTLFSKSLTEIFIENQLEYLINKSPYPHDPFHLNDIQPALENSSYYNKGDLFLSIRQLSIIMQYRPETNEVIKIIEGPFLLQHDIDILSPNTIAILNNNNISNNTYNDDVFKPTNETFERKINHSNVLIYNFEEDSFTPLYEESFISNKIWTGAEGLYTLMDNKDLFFEEQNSGILWVINKNGVVLKTTLKSNIEGYHYLPNWTTVYTKLKK